MCVCNSSELEEIKIIYLSIMNDLCNKSSIFGVVAHTALLVAMSLCSA